MMTLLGILAFPAVADARPKDRDLSYSASRYDWNDRHRRHYYSVPRSGFTLTFGTGYAGRGYYYGPPGAAYFYQRPGVMFYRNRYSVPNYYWGRGYDRLYSGRSTEVAVQRALYRMGYYRGPIDGDIGPGTSRAIARFERDRGLPVRGFISRTLLDALGLI
jgi:hypothetical protein